MSYAPLHETSESDRNRTIPNGGADDLDGTSTSPSSQARMSPSARASLAEPLTSGGATPSSNGSTSQDPFFVFREDLYKKLELVDEALAEYLRIVHQTDTSVNTHELKDAKKQLKRHMKNAESTLKDVQMTVQLIENDREKFPDVNDRELYERSSLVHASRDRLHKAKEEVNSEAVKAKMLADERAKAIRRAGADSLGAQTDGERMNTSFIVDSQARTSLLMQHQDETLDELDVAVTRVGHIAENIHDEIGQQNKMLNEMEDDLEDAEQQLGMVMGKLGKFLQTKDRFQICTIVGLFLTAVVLLFLIVYVP